MKTIIVDGQELKVWFKTKHKSRNQNITKTHKRIKTKCKVCGVEYLANPNSTTVGFCNTHWYFTKRKDYIKQKKL